MEKRRKGEMRKQKKVSQNFLLLLAVLQITAPSSAQNTTSTTTTSTTSITSITTSTSAPNPAVLSYRTRPHNIKVAVGEPAVFLCGVPRASSNVTFTFYGSHHNYTLRCPSGHMEDIPQALYGSCDVKNGELLAVWTLKGTSFSDNGTKVVCQQSRNPSAVVAVLHVYDNGASYATLIGCAIGGFFGILLVFGLLYAALLRSENLQKCFRGNEIEDDMTTIVTKE
ncbi:uncharacterized protein LOC126391704 [Epinephelus moara]|uniref:uncharacterized protein LOC126391704 n=1 Tax=Epinephelus moara TaxID=300413 RepID=UPI00214F3EB5|nr:uncharacterized protein LOC126391704 [Epinephelus moara]